MRAAQVVCSTVVRACVSTCVFLCASVPAEQALLSGVCVRVCVCVCLHPCRSNPDPASMRSLVRSYAPTVSSDSLSTLVDAVQELTRLVEAGMLTYPYSTRGVFRGQCLCRGVPPRYTHTHSLGRPSVFLSPYRRLQSVLIFGCPCVQSSSTLCGTWRRTQRMASPLSYKTCLRSTRWVALTCCRSEVLR
jgi:hypothetical protein